MWLTVHHEDHIKTELCLPFPDSVPRIEGKLDLESTVGVAAGEIVLFVKSTVGVAAGEIVLFVKRLASFQWSRRHPDIVKDQLPGC